MDDEFVTYPTETNATDEEGQHFVYEFEMMGEMFLSMVIFPFFAELFICYIIAYILYIFA